jgi:hypothetical protein
VRAYTAAVERGDPGGRVIVMDLVVGSSPEDAKATEMLLPRDVMMMGWWEPRAGQARASGSRPSRTPASAATRSSHSVSGGRPVIEVYP